VAQHESFIKSTNAAVMSSLAVQPLGADKQSKDHADADAPPIRIGDYTLNPLYAASNAWLGLAAGTIQTYSAACTLFTNAQSELHSLGAVWQDELDSLVQILETGQRVVKRQIDMVIREGEAMTPAPALDEQQAITLLGMKSVVSHGAADRNGGTSSDCVSWLESIKAAERGAKRMSKGLPSYQGMGM